jgi:Zn-finger protein
MKKKHSYLVSEEQVKQIQNWIPLDFKFGTWAHCFYCGCTPNSQDHVIPWSMMYSVEKHKGSDKGPRTPACMNCNLVLQSSFFDTLHERCSYVKKYLSNKHSKLLKTEDWSKDELKDVQGKLKNYIIDQQNLKKEVEPRVLWQNSKQFICEFEKAYEKAVIEYPFNSNLHKFMKPHWHLSNLDQQVVV